MIAWFASSRVYLGENTYTNLSDQPSLHYIAWFTFPRGYIRENTYTNLSNTTNLILLDSLFQEVITGAMSCMYVLVFLPSSNKSMGPAWYISHSLLMSKYTPPSSDIFILNIVDYYQTRRATLLKKGDFER